MPEPFDQWLREQTHMSLQNATDRLSSVGLAVPDEVKTEEHGAYKDLFRAVERPGRDDRPRVGADPEFELVTEDGTSVPASNHIRDYDNNNVIGVDGHAATGELRPVPGSGLFCASNVARSMKDLRDLLPANITVRAGGGRHLPLGGHVHVSNREATLTVADFMESFIGQPLKARQSPSSVRTGHTDYNHSFGFRLQPHGWEYRTPPSWLCSPEHTRGVLVLSNLAATLDDRQLKSCLANRDNVFEHLTIEAPLVHTYFEALADETHLENLAMFQRWGLSDFELQFGNCRLIITADEPDLDFLRDRLADIRTATPIEIVISGTMTGHESQAVVCVPEGYYSQARNTGQWPARVYNYDEMGNSTPNFIISPRLIVALRENPEMKETVIEALLGTLGGSYV